MSEEKAERLENSNFWKISNGAFRAALATGVAVMLIVDRELHQIHKFISPADPGNALKQSALGELLPDVMIQKLRTDMAALPVEAAMLFGHFSDTYPGSRYTYEYQLLPYGDGNLSLLIKPLKTIMPLNGIDGFNAVFNSTYYSLLLIHADGKIIKANKFLIDALKLKGIMLPENAYELLSFFNAGITDKEAKELIIKAAAGEAVMVDGYLEAKDCEMYLQITIKPVLDENEQVNYLVVECRDITTSRKLEKEMQRKDKLYMQLAQNIPRGGILLTNKKLEYIFMAGPALADMGYDPKEMLGKYYKDAIPENNFKNAKGPYEAAINDGKVMTVEVLQANGRWYRSNVAPLRGEAGEIEGVMSVFYDINDLKVSQLDIEEKLEALARSESLYRTLTQHIPNGAVLQFDLEGKFVMAEGSKFGEHTGVTNDAFLGKKISEILPPKLMPQLNTHLEQVFSGETVTLTIQSPFSGRNYLITCSPLSVGDKITGGIAMCMDIQEFDDMQKELEQKQNLYRELARSIPEGAIIMYDQRFHYSLCEGVALQSLGMLKGCAGQGDLKDVFPVKNYQLLQPLLAKALEGHYYSEEFISHSGRWIRLSTIPIRNQKDEIEGGVAVVLDIQSQKATELELQTKIAALEVSQKTYKTLAQNIPNGAILMFNKEKRFTLAEGPGIELAGYKSIEYLGHTPAEMLPSNLVQTYDTLYDRVLKGESLSAEIKGARTGRYMSVNMAPIYTSGGELEGGIVVIFDIQHLKEVEAQLEEKLEALKYSEHLYRTLAQKIPNAALMMYDKDMRFSLVEGDVLDDIGFSKESMEGSVLKDLVSPEEYEALYPLYNGPLAGETISQEVSTVTGREFLSTYFPMRDHKGEIIGGMVVAFDIHVLKNTERELEKKVAELSQLNNKLNKEISIRSQVEENLKQYADELKVKNQELEQFAYVASHDLQEPLRMISSFAQLLARKYDRMLDEDGQTFIGFITEGAQRMQALINDLLAYSRIDSRAKPPTSVKLGDVLEIVKNNLSIKLDETGTELIYGELPTLNAEATQLGQLFQNLITNAIKFVKPGHTPRIEIKVESQASKWHFIVKDNGIGINSQHQERIFQIFQRLHSRENYEGTGIGLAICKKIVERHGGEIWVESEPDKGATFHFTLPKIS